MEVESDHNNQTTSEFTLNSVLASFRNLTNRRYEFFRNMCIFLSLIDRFNEKLHVSRQISTEACQSFFGATLNSMNSYAYLKWLSEAYPLRVDKSLWEKNFRRAVDILDDTSLVNFKEAAEYNQLLLKHYLHASGKFCAPLAKSVSRKATPNEAVSSLTLTVLKLTWPMNVDATCDLLKYLIFHVQYIHLSAYCFQTKWQASTKNLRHFLSAHCCLFFDNIDQSISLFLKASYNLEKEQHLKRLMKLNAGLIASGKLNDENMTLMSYYTKVIHYFDLNGNLEAAIELIQNALLKCHFNSANKVLLFCWNLLENFIIYFLIRLTNKLNIHIQLLWRFCWI